MYKLATVLFALFALFAGQVLADPNDFNITIVNSDGANMNVTADLFLTVSDQDLQTTCAPNTTAALNAIKQCTNTNATCLCEPATTKLVADAEQCYFNKLVKDNRPMPGKDNRAGGQTALAAYGTACKASNLTIKLETADFSLALAPNWNGPFGQGLSPATTAITLIATLILGSGCIATVILM